MYLEEGCIDSIRDEAYKQLKLLGIKATVKSADYKPQTEKRIEVYHVFKTSLELLEKESVKIPQSSVLIEIPVFVIDSCRFIEQNLSVTGLFRTAGSISKQRELRALLDCGNRLSLNDEHQVTNVANILKLFFRELPEPLIPFKYHNILIKCLSLKQKKIEAVLLVCLLLPNDHINTLAYLLLFLHNVSENSKKNKMDVGNLAIIFAPGIMPVSTQKITVNTSEKLNNHTQIIQILIENAHDVGVVPENISEKLVQISNSFSNGDIDLSISQKRKKRRANSLTRMITGIKKIITKTSPEIQTNANLPQTTYTPRVMSRKRKTEPTGFSSKKRLEVLETLPGRSALANTPYTPHKIKYSSTTMLTPRTIITAENGIIRKGSKISTKRKQAKIFIADSPISCDNNANDENEKLEQTDESSQEFIRIPKNEYEAIKERVSQIESRLEHEFDNMLGVSINSEDENNEENKQSLSFQNIENAYKTLEESGKLNQSRTDQLTKKFNKELRLRRNSDHMIRSPSARKIGSIRRRSREIDRQISLNTCDRPNLFNSNNSTRSLRRGRPNTVFSGLPQPSPHSDSVKDEVTDKKNWERADLFLMRNKESFSDGSRDSIVKIRNQNVGMVLAKAKLFDNLSQTENIQNDINLKSENEIHQNNCLTIKNDITPSKIILRSHSCRTGQKEDIKENKRRLSTRLNNNKAVNSPGRIIKKSSNNKFALNTLQKSNTKSPRIRNKP